MSNQPAFRMVLRVIEESSRMTDPSELRAKLEPERPIDVAYDPVTNAMMLAAVEIWQGARNELGDPRPLILTHAVQLGLALLFNSHDYPDEFNPPHDGCLDTIDKVRTALGLDTSGDEPMSLLDASKRSDWGGDS